MILRPRPRTATASGRASRALKTTALSFFAIGLFASLPELLSAPGARGADGLIAWVPLGQAFAALGAYLVLLHPFVARRPLLAGLFMGVGSGLSLGVLLALRAGVDTPLRGVTRLATVALLVMMLSLPWWILIRALLPVGQLEERVRAQIRELRLLAAHLERAREEERSRIARELHDELGQELTATRYGWASSSSASSAIREASAATSTSSSPSSPARRRRRVSCCPSCARAPSTSSGSTPASRGSSSRRARRPASAAS